MLADTLNGAEAEADILPHSNRFSHYNTPFPALKGGFQVDAGRSV